MSESHGTPENDADARLEEGRRRKRRAAVAALRGIIQLPVIGSRYQR
jgi:hypothetical protein